MLPVRERGKPTLGDFTEKEVKQCLRFDSRFQKSTIVALLKLEKAEPQYLVPLQVFLLQHQRTQESSARESSQEKVQQLTVELAKQRQELEHLRQQAAEERIEFVQTEQHREVCPLTNQGHSFA